MRYLIWNFPAWLLPLAVIPAALRAWDIGRAVDRAIDKSGLNRATVAGRLGISEAQLSRAIAGAGPEHLSADRLTNFPREKWVYLWLEIGEAIGVLDDADTRARKEAKRLHRQVRASLAHDNAGDGECSESVRARGVSSVA